MAKIIIVGGGVAGLSAGIYAGLAGHDAVICERHTKPGGNLTGWQRGEYHIDNCIHWLTGTNPMTDTYKMWCDLGVLGDVDIYQGDVLYTCERDGKRLSLYRSIDKIEREMLFLSPEDKNEILSFTSAVRTIRKMCGTGGEYSNEKISLPGLVCAVPNLLKYYFLSCGELSKRFSHPLIRDLIVSVLGEQFGALSLLVVFTTFTGDNGGIPSGSSVAMADRMSERFKSLGGELILDRAVIGISGEGKKANGIFLADGTEIYADYIILATDPQISYEKLLGKSMPTDFSKIYNDARMPRFSSYHAAFSCDADAVDFRGDFVFEIPDAAKRILRTKYLIIREFSHESGFYPPGKNIIQTITFCDEAFSRRLISLRKNMSEYMNFKSEIAKVIRELIVSKFPSLSDSLECIDVWTPASYNRYTDAQIGSYMSAVLPSRRLPLPISCESGVYDNVVLATQWQNPPGGLPIAADMGRRAVSKILQKMRGL